MEKTKIAITKTENPRVGGSIPPLGTTILSSIFSNLMASQRKLRGHFHVAHVAIFSPFVSMVP